MAVNLGSIIWTAVRAILKFIITASFGTILARSKLLDSTGTRAISQCILNVFLPCLLFTKIVQGIDEGKMRQVGVLALTAILYTVLGLVFGYIVKFLTKVPRGWQSGVLAAGAFSNWGDLPLVVIGTIVTAAPFGGAADEAKGLAYVAVFMFVQSTLMFVLNGVWLISRDYDHPIEEAEPARSISGKVKSFTAWLRIPGRRGAGPERDAQKLSRDDSWVDDATGPASEGERAEEPSAAVLADSRTLALRRGDSLGLARRPSEESLCLRPITSGVLDHGDMHSTIDTSAITKANNAAAAAATLPTHHHRTRPSGASLDSSTVRDEEEVEKEKTAAMGSRHWPSWARYRTILKASLVRLLSPPSAAVISAFVIAVVPTLKSLFVRVPGSSMPLAPDGNPPLDFIIDITDFIGAASVPSSLLILGYSLSRLRVRSLPALSSAVVMAGLKMVVMPVLAIAWMQFLADPHGRGHGLVDPADLVLRLVLVLPSAVPTATSLLYITQIFAPEGRDEGVACLSVFLIVQYLVVGLTLTVTVVYTLNIIT
ncbi:protein of unknown function [Taphrina deformans PYCC 5710]|uniref:Auxin Efflux Carrier superfamily n=1 Tax=Taphrina deformans (strain PYCC 5710 / ATCC 11124 / CBS 356.35 / IMI 108563 / JCM 9778 / NBRC 8474) TaxID=1097556 RepID=R4XFS2_TAPDE|nr:protein of unknown function [Taphrina deformans PYCC 5710]|eukprot:CCG84711.1 protein of unknown function [Taphrina deformans PYCC 5710]